MKAALNAPSPNRRRNRLGSRRATKNASATGPSPSRAAISMSRAKPSTRLAIVQPPTVTMPRSIRLPYSSRRGRASSRSAASASPMRPPSRSATARQIGRSSRAGARHQRGRGRDSFDDARAGRQRLGQRRAAAKCEAEGEVPAGRPGAGQQQVAEAGKPGDGLRPAAQRRGQPPELGKPPRDQGGARILAEAGADHRPGRDRDHVLRRAPTCAPTGSALP